MSYSAYNLNKVQEQLKSISESSDLPLYTTESFQDILVNIRADLTIAQGLFKPDPQLAGGYRAHPITILALKKNIFFTGANFDDLEKLYVCESCKTQIDLQFWHFCPYCESQISDH